MRADDAGARTWLLAAVAGWGLLAWLLAVFGMGNRIAPLPDDAGLVKPIPALPASSTNRLGTLGQYAEIGARPLFAEDRRPKPFSLQGDDGTETREFDYLLTSVLITPNLHLAILQSPDGSKSVRVKLGEAPESHPAWRLGALTARSAVFDGPSGQRKVELRVFDGAGGQPPTAVAREGEPPVDMPMARTNAIPASRSSSASLIRSPVSRTRSARRSFTARTISRRTRPEVKRPTCMSLTCAMVTPSRSRGRSRRGRVKRLTRN